MASSIKNSLFVASFLFFSFITGFNGNFRFRFFSSLNVSNGPFSGARIIPCFTLKWCARVKGSMHNGHSSMVLTLINCVLLGILVLNEDFHSNTPFKRDLHTSHVPLQSLSIIISTLPYSTFPFPLPQPPFFHLSPL